MRALLISLFFFVFFSPVIVVGNARADVEWLKALESCDKYAEQINTRFGPLGGLSLFPASYKVELRKALDIGCAGKFQDCGFIHCTIPESVLYAIDGKLVRKADPEVKDLKTAWGEEKVKERIARVKSEGAGHQAQILSRAQTGEQLQAATGKGWEEFEVPMDADFKANKIKKPKAAGGMSGPPGSQFGK